MHTHRRAQTYARTAHTRTHAHRRTQAQTHARTHRRAHARTDACTHAPTQTDARTRTPAHARKRTHARAHELTHARCVRMTITFFKLFDGANRVITTILRNEQLSGPLYRTVRFMESVLFSWPFRCSNTVRYPLKGVGRSSRYSTVIQTKYTHIHIHTCNINKIYTHTHMHTDTHSCKDKETLPFSFLLQMHVNARYECNVYVNTIKPYWS